MIFVLSFGVFFLHQRKYVNSVGPSIGVGTLSKGHNMKLKGWWADQPGRKKQINKILSRKTIFILSDFPSVFFVKYCIAL